MSENMTALEKAREASRIQRESGEVRVVTHNWIVKSRRKPTSLKLAINAKCFECMGGTVEDLPDSGWKDDIRNCTAGDTCALFSHRPYRVNAPDSEEDSESDEI